MPQEGHALPKKPNAELKERLGDVLGRVELELQKIEERRTELKNLIVTLQYVSGDNQTTFTGRRLSASARKKIAKAQKARWKKLRTSRKYNRAANVSSPPWTDKDDTLIIQAAKAHGPVEAPTLARGLHAKLSGRSEGAIRQRIAKLAHRGVLRQHSERKGPGIARMVVEAA